jgi:hypothetical protein
MPSPSRRGRDRTPEQWLQATENARREARFRFARDRIGKIVAADPPLTAEQRAELARLLTAGDAA